MAGLLEFLSAPFFHKPVSPDPYATHWVVGIVYKLHTMTGTFMFLSSCFVFAKELLNDHIHCITDMSDAVENLIPERAFDAYCYISDTFTLPRSTLEGKKDYDLAYVGPIGSNKAHELIYHNYYMWVPYLLLVQSASFFVPLLLHRFWQEGRVQLLLAGLHNLIAFNETRDDKYGDVKLYFKDWYNHQNWWAFKLFVCDALNLLVVILNILLTDWYLGRQFYGYGINSMAHMVKDPLTRGHDPFNLLFPKMTKCTLNTYGPSGTIQNFDGLCVLPINVLNEKIYLLAWFFLFSLALFTLVHHLVALVIIMNKSFRKATLLWYVSPNNKSMRKKLSIILDFSGVGDWLMLFLLAKNTNRVVFGQIVDNLKYPDYDFNLEPLDKENLILEARHETHSLVDA